MEIIKKEYDKFEIIEKSVIDKNALLQKIDVYQREISFHQQRIDELQQTIDAIQNILKG